MKIAVGVTTVPERINDLLPKTLKSLETAGFTRSRLFVDGVDNPLPFFGWNVDVTCRGDRIGNFGNWYLGMVELFCRNPDADRYLMFEDDIVVCRGLREYLSRVEMPKNGYCNLYLGGERNPVLAVDKSPGWFLSDQLGIGALSLMFDRATVIRMLGSTRFVSHRLERTILPGWKCQRGEMNVDGAVLLALRNCGDPQIQEYCHNPGLVQHIGAGNSTLGNEKIAESPLFAGEKFDARTLLA